MSNLVELENMGEKSRIFYGLGEQYHKPKLCTTNRRLYLGSSEMARIVDGGGPIDTPARSFGRIAHSLLEWRLKGRPTSIVEVKRADVGFKNGVAYLVPSDCQKMKNVMNNAGKVLQRFSATPSHRLAIEAAVYVPLKVLEAHTFKQAWAIRMRSIALALGRSPKAMADILQDNGDGTWTWIDWKTTVASTIKEMRHELVRRQYLLRVAWHIMTFKAAGYPIKAVEFILLQKGRIGPAVAFKSSLEDGGFNNIVGPHLPTPKEAKQMDDHLRERVINITL